jgi:hypothetical protein
MAHPRHSVPSRRVPKHRLRCVAASLYMLMDSRPLAIGSFETQRGRLAEWVVPEPSPLKQATKVTPNLTPNGMQSGAPRRRWVP